MTSKRSRGRDPAADPLSGRIVDAALALAEDSGWANLRLHRVAARLGVPLSQVRRRFRDQDAIADSWFARALAAMLVAAERPGFARRPARERVETLLLAWFDALAGHRRVTAEMIAVKFHPPHLHHWIPAIFNASRLIQWLRDAARLDASGVHRAAEEIALTALFLGALAIWTRDQSPGQERTRRFLARALGRARRGGGLIAP